MIKCYMCLHEDREDTEEPCSKCFNNDYCYFEIKENTRLNGKRLFNYISQKYNITVTSERLINNIISYIDDIIDNPTEQYEMLCSLLEDVIEGITEKELWEYGFSNNEYGGECMYNAIKLEFKNRWGSIEKAHVYFPQISRVTTESGEQKTCYYFRVENNQYVLKVMCEAEYLYHLLNNEVLEQLDIVNVEFYNIGTI